MWNRSNNFQYTSTPGNTKQLFYHFTKEVYPHLLRLRAVNKEQIFFNLPEKNVILFSYRSVFIYIFFFHEHEHIERDTHETNSSGNVWREGQDTTEGLEGKINLYSTYFRVKMTIYGKLVLAFLSFYFKPKVNETKQLRQCDILASS